MAQKYVKVVHDIKATRQQVSYVVGITQGFQLDVTLHQGSALSFLLFATVMDRLADER